jgi:hypothetical protein
MLDAVRLHTVTHLRFFARSRLILGLSIVLAALWTLGLLAFLLMDSSGDRFDMLKTIAGQVRLFAWVYTAAMGLFALWWHTSQRTTTLLFTRPGRPEIWLASVFGSAFLAAVAIHGAGLLLTLVLSLVWGIPYQIGFVWLAIDGVLESVIIVSVLTGLAAVIHPAIAIVLVVFFTESIFYMMDTMLLGYLQAHGRTLWLGAVEYAIRGVHIVVPMLDPFSQHTRNVEASLRVAGSDWQYLAATAGYAACVCTFWFLFADYRLRRNVIT